MCCNFGNRAHSSCALSQSTSCASVALHCVPSPFFASDAKCQGRAGAAEVAVGGWGRGRGKRDSEMGPETFRSFGRSELGRLPPPSSGSGNWHIDRRRLEQKFGVFIQPNADLYSEDWSVRRHLFLFFDRAYLTHFCSTSTLLVA